MQAAGGGGGGGSPTQPASGAGSPVAERPREEILHQLLIALGKDHKKESEAASQALCKAFQDMLAWRPNILHGLSRRIRERETAIPAIRTLSRIFLKELDYFQCSLHIDGNFEWLVELVEDPRSETSAVEFAIKCVGQLSLSLLGTQKQLLLNLAFRLRTARDPSRKERLAYCFHKLTHMSPDLSAAAPTQVVKTLMPLLENGHSPIAWHVAGVLANFTAAAREMRVAVRRANGVPALLGLLVSADDRTASLACGALQNVLLAKNIDGEAGVSVDPEQLDALRAMLQMDSTKRRFGPRAANAATVIWSLAAQNTRWKETLKRKGLIMSLCCMAQIGNAREANVAEMGLREIASGSEALEQAVLEAKKSCEASHGPDGSRLPHSGAGGPADEAEAPLAHEFGTYEGPVGWQLPASEEESRTAKIFQEMEGHDAKRKAEDSDGNVDGGEAGQDDADEAPGCPLEAAGDAQDKGQQDPLWGVVGKLPGWDVLEDPQDGGQPPFCGDAREMPGRWVQEDQQGGQQVPWDDDVRELPILPVMERWPAGIGAEAGGGGGNSVLTGRVSDRPEDGESSGALSEAAGSVSVLRSGSPFNSWSLVELERDGGEVADGTSTIGSSTVSGSSGTEMSQEDDEMQAATGTASLQGVQLQGDADCIADCIAFTASVGGEASTDDRARSVVQAHTTDARPENAEQVGDQMYSCADDSARETADEHGIKSEGSVLSSFDAQGLFRPDACIGTQQLMFVAIILVIVMVPAGVHWFK